MKKKTNKKELTVLLIWFACYIAALQFFRFSFGLFQISAVFVAVGISLMLLIDRTKKTQIKPNGK